MAELKIENSDIPSLKGKVALITGGSSGIGLALAKLLLSKSCTVHVADLHPPNPDEDKDAEDWDEWTGFTYHCADVRVWASLQGVFRKIGRVELVFANAGTTDADPALLDLSGQFLEDEEDGEGNLEAPLSTYDVLDTNVRGVLNTVKLARWAMAKHGVQEGSIVITGSSGAYWPDHYVPIGSVSWGAQVNLIRALQHVLSREGITINGVAVFVAACRLVPLEVGLTFLERGIPFSETKDVALALAYSATAKQSRAVEVEGNAPRESVQQEGRWNGRVIQVLGDKYREIEEPFAEMRYQWFGKQFSESLLKAKEITASGEV